MHNDPATFRAVEIGAFSSPDGVVVLRVRYLVDSPDRPEDTETRHYHFPMNETPNIVQALLSAASESEEMTRKDRGQQH